ncbi:hypothetical protein B0H14DRAFT_3153480 [Mycena olivaceomarginata]|nr:hypothetical protein B0H14DRAFT_3153480 [Mycena olivaceomarginata]
MGRQAAGTEPRNIATAIRYVPPTPKRNNACRRTRIPSSLPVSPLATHSAPNPSTPTHTQTRDKRANPAPRPPQAQARARASPPPPLHLLLHARPTAIPHRDVVGATHAHARKKHGVAWKQDAARDKEERNKEEDWKAKKERSKNKTKKTRNHTARGSRKVDGYKGGQGERAQSTDTGPKREQENRIKKMHPLSTQKNIKKRLTTWITPIVWQAALDALVARLLAPVVPFLLPPPPRAFWAAAEEPEAEDKRAFSAAWHLLTWRERRSLGVVSVQTQGDAARIDGEELDQNIPASIVIVGELEQEMTYLCRCADYIGSVTETIFHLPPHLRRSTHSSVTLTISLWILSGYCIKKSSQIQISFSAEYFALPKKEIPTLHVTTGHSKAQNLGTFALKRKGDTVQQSDEDQPSKHSRNASPNGSSIHSDNQENPDPDSLNNLDLDSETDGEIEIQEENDSRKIGAKISKHRGQELRKLDKERAAREEK